MQKKSFPLFVFVALRPKSTAMVMAGRSVHLTTFFLGNLTGGKPRNYHEIVLTQICYQATSGTRRGSFQAENWIKKGWCHFYFCFILQLKTNNGEIRQCGSV